MPVLIKKVFALLANDFYAKIAKIIGILKVELLTTYSVD